jgi:hypothetical protein
MSVKVNVLFDKSFNERGIPILVWYSLMKSMRCVRVEQHMTLVPQLVLSINCWQRWTVSIKWQANVSMWWQQPIEWVCCSSADWICWYIVSRIDLDILDPAILRPGRLDKHIYVGLPDTQGRLDILNTITKVSKSLQSSRIFSTIHLFQNGTRPPMAADVRLSAISEDPRCDGYT